MLVRPTSLAQVYLTGFAAEHLLMCRQHRSFDVEVGLGLLAHLDPHLVETIDGVEAADGYGAVHQALRSGVREVEDDIRREVERLYGVAFDKVPKSPTERVLKMAEKTVGEAVKVAKAKLAPDPVGGGGREVPQQ